MELTFTEMDDLEFLGSGDLTNDLDLTNDSYATYFDKQREVNKKQGQKITTQKQIIQTNKQIHVQKETNQSKINETNSIINEKINSTKSALKKPTISFDDILNNMNLTLMDGKLIFAPAPPSLNKKNVHFSENNLEERNNYPLNPLTKEEILKKKLIDYANYRNELIRASKIKSTRLQFTNNNNPTIHTRQTEAFNRIFALKK